MRTLLAASTLLVSALPGPTSAQSPFEVRSIQHDAGGLWFLAPDEIDWASRAPADLRDLPIPTRDADLVARFAPEVDMFGGVEIGTTVPVPPEIAVRNVFFAGPDGIMPLRLDSAVAVTRLELDPQGATIEGRSSWGRIYATPERGPAAGGGFVLRAAGPLTFQLTSTDMNADDLLMRSTTIERTSDGGYFARGTAFWEIVAQYRFSIGADPRTWVFVQWAADDGMVEAGCAFRYELFELDANGGATSIGWTSYGCDV
ncbi:MAG: hypothetical protein AB7T31_10080 [Gemmatimonadales bacterium]